MRYLTIDFETKDPYLDKKVNLGSGWVYKMNVSNHMFKIVGASMRTHEGKYLWLDDIESIRKVVNGHDAYIMHNSQYDLGILYSIAANVKDKPIYDTKIAAYLYDTNMETSMDALAKAYLKINKGHMDMTQEIIKRDLYPYTKKELNDKKKALDKGLTYERTYTDDKLKKVTQWIYQNMDYIYEQCPEIIIDYAIKDVEITYKLFEFFNKNAYYDVDMVHKYSFISHICINTRKKGVRVDLERAREVANILLPKADELDKEVYKIAGKEFNIKSMPQLSEVFTELGIKFKKTDKGNGSFTEQFLSNLDHPIGKAITSARKCRNIVNNFIVKIIDMQEYTLGIDKKEIENTKYGVVYPEFRPFAAVTGRFNCIGPNIQQTPSRDEYLSPLIRSIFIPFEGETWYSLDFSNQEGRLMISDAFTLGCPGASEIVDKFKKDPSYDMHQLVADMIGIKRKEAKAINLGLSYGMGGAKLCKSLNKPTQWMVRINQKIKEDENEVEMIREDDRKKLFKTKLEADEYGSELKSYGYSFNVFEIAGEEGQRIVNAYKKAAPYLDKLISICMESLQRKGYIKTVSGRRCSIDKPIMENGKLRTFEYKALNKRIQGSAFDQTSDALIWAYKEGIPLLFSVHDEINISSSNPEHAIRLKHIMENAIQLAVPCLTEITSGDSWGACKFS